MDDAKLEVLRIEIAKLELGYGDALVAKVPTDTPQSACEALERFLREHLRGIGVRVMVIAGDVDLSVVSAKPMIIVGDDPQEASHGG